VKKVFVGEKTLLKLSAINFIKVPIYEELSVKRVLDLIKTEEEI
jgi:hypothetical protein